MPDDSKRGRFVWYDLMTNDAEAAIDFYTSVIGWGTESFEGGSKPYTMWTVGDQPVGGVADIDPETMGEMPPNWMAHVFVPDVDETAERIRELGGQIHAEPTDIPDVGRFAVAADPQGASFAIFASEQSPGEIGRPSPGEFSWHELATTDHAAAFDFYSELFDWKKTSDFDMGETGTYLIYGQDGREYGGMYDKSGDMPGPPFWLFYVYVDDLDETVEAVEEHGGQIINGPMEVPGGDRVAQCMDPQGAVFALHGK